MIDLVFFNIKIFPHLPSVLRKLLLYFKLGYMNMTTHTWSLTEMDLTLHHGRRWDAFITSLKSSMGAEKKGLWSVSMTNTSSGGHLRIMASCCCGFTMLSCVVFIYTRLACSNPSTLSNLVLGRVAGHGRSSMEANVESWAMRRNTCWDYKSISCRTYQSMTRHKEGKYIFA